ncbi:hypothetical protein [Methylobacterium sp. GC_Met_2]|uniref:hypothetical protein n=1 Tax=Methylobacterium sp. GC_Met_2 TaxID=2937376 RepID=UPI00226B82B4|nr:hypothetical protein [Methylobacterium sp. GC_Met_2]
MRPKIFIIGFSILAAQPAFSYEKTASLQTEDPLTKSNSVTAPIFHRRNAEAKARQDKFDRRIDLSNREMIASICSGCESGQIYLISNHRQEFDAHEGSSISAETIYLTKNGFDPAQAGGGWD